MRLILTLLLALIATACSSSSPAESIDFNDGWRFTLGEMDSEYYDANTNDSSWQSIRVPHDWSIELGYTQENTAGSNGFLPGGIGWYRNTFEVPKQMRGKSIFVRFEGVYNNSHVWINGHELGFYPFGYLDFEYDLTPYLNESGENIITVRVDRRAYADSRWYVGAGIYRPVHLISRGEVYIPTHGQFITTPKITEESATINVRTEFTSNSDIGKTYDIVYQIYNSESVVCYKSQSVDVPIGEVTESCIDITIPTPKLWSPTSPNRYTLCTYISVGDELIEKREESFGIRTLEFNPAKGLLINGEYTKIKGVNIHHDLGCVGVALNNDVLRRRLRKMQELGVNAVRMAH
ncbi:MAG: sugar-binding domain-containing protein, partial [Rikenellaceae bacterium]